MSTPTPSLTSSTVTPTVGNNRHNGDAAAALLQLQMSENSSDNSSEKDDSSKKRSRSTDTDDNPFDTEIIVERVVQNPSKLNNSVMDDVKISLLSDNPIRKVSKRKDAKPFTENDYSQLVSISGIIVSDLSVHELRMFCSNNSLGGRKFNKKSICDTIATAKHFPPKVKEEAVSTVKKRIHVNRKRYCNVIFSDGIRPLLANRGEPLTKDQLTEGLKTDEILHRSIIKEYNNPEKHNIDAFPQLQNCRGDPSKMSGRIEWTQSAKMLKDIVRDYEKCFNNWKLSGNHGAFGETDTTKERIPFSQFIMNNHSLLYLHEFVYQFPNIFEKMTGKLPEGCFSESIGDDGNKPSLKKSKASKTKASKSIKDDDKWEKWEKVQQTNIKLNEKNVIINEKNSVVRQYETYCNILKTAQCSLEDAHNRKENTLRSLSKDIDSNFREVKQRFRYYRSNKEQKSNDSFEDDGSGVNDDLNLEYTESQGSTFDRILKYDEHSRHHEKLIEKTTKTITNLQATYDYL